MKNTILFVVLLALSLAFIACNKDDEEIVLDFELTLPEDWQSNIYGETDYVMDATRKQVNQNDSFPESVVVYKTSFQSANLALYYANLQPLIQGSAAYDSMYYDTDTTINAIAFKKMVSQEHLKYIDTYSHDTVVVAAITERYFTYKDNYGYNLTFVAINKVYPQSKTIFNEIIGTFRFK
jgi:hypothetical protein